MPRVIVTGTMSTQHAAQQRVAPGEAHAPLQIDSAQRRDEQQELGHGAEEGAPDQGVDAERAVAREQHDEGDDDEVPDDRHDRRHGEALVGVQDADHDARDAEQQHRGQQDAQHLDGEVAHVGLVGELREEDAHDQGRAQHEHERHRTNHHDHEAEQRRGQPIGALALPLGEQAGEDRHEGRADRRVGDELADEVGDDGDRGEGVELHAHAERIGREDLAGDAHDARDAGRSRHHDGRPGEPLLSFSHAS